MVAVRHLLVQCLQIALVVSSALTLWKGLGLVLNTASPIVVVLSGSMEPAIRRGDLLFLARRTKLAIGDITVYSLPSSPVPIVHRIVSLHGDNRFLTKGDNNPVDDVGLYRGPKFLEEKDIVGKVHGYVPYVGYVTIAMVRPPPATSRADFRRTIFRN